MLIGPVFRCRGVMSMRDIDFGLAGELGVGFSGLRVRKSEILATGVRRESRAILARQRGVSPTTLRGRSAEASGDDLPVVAMDAGGGQVQHDAPHRGLDPGMSIADARRQLGSQSRATSAGRRRTATRPFQVRGLERLREERILRRLFGTRA